VTAVAEVVVEVAARGILRLCAWLLLLWVCLPAGLAVPVAAAAQPKFVLVLTDDMDVAPLARMSWTQSLLRQQDTAFTRAYYGEPLCGPSRASIFTGLYPQNTGVYRNSHRNYYELGNPASSLRVWLKAAGYRTALVGKYMNGYPAPETSAYIPPGWDEWQARYRGRPDADGQYGYWLSENGVSVYYGTGPSDYATDVYRKKAITFIKGAISAGTPFYLHFAVHAPNTPFVPAPRHATLFPSACAPRPPSFNEADVSDKPAYVQALPPLDAATRAGLDEDFRNRLRMLKAVDQAMNQIVDTLAAGNQLANTYILLASDNGWVMGPHRIVGAKGVPYDEALRMPLLIRRPDVPAGLALDHLVGNVDLMPTILDLAGVPIPVEVDGRSLVPLFEADRPAASTWRQAFPITFRDGDDPLPVPSWQGLRSPGYTYLEYPATGERELYDLSLEPYQLQNIALTADPALLATLSDRTRAFAACAVPTAGPSRMRLFHKLTFAVGLAIARSSRYLTPMKSWRIRWSSGG
jgi:N-acetylglucosamine-6-sulfatase